MDVPGLELSVGLEVYASNTEGVGGFLKQVPEDFVVEEVTPEDLVCGIEGSTVFPEGVGRYTHFTLVKTSWTVFRALGELGKRLRVSRKRFGYAGVKDKEAVTAQRVSVFGVPVPELERVKIRDVLLKDFSQSDVPIHLGMLSGNKFMVTVRGIQLSEKDCESRVSEMGECLESGFPNFFGLQRFGVQRPITHLVGKHILKGDFEAAVMTYLSGFADNKYAREDEVTFRKFVADTGDFQEALKLAPAYLGPEKSILNALVENPGDFVGALKSLPDSLQTMFVHAFQSYVFNKALSKCLREGYTVERLPLVGFKSSVDEVSKSILDVEGIAPGDFDVRGSRNWCSQGDVRECFEFAQDLEFQVSADELNDDCVKTVFSFRLQPGVYATVFLREFLKNKHWETKQVNP